ncbi:polysaccharide biosynthesis tyrosine autokinase [Chroococcidiopsis sp. CCNUC1]|nr:polysaccharide biosynthesis tyrosine autokinase [Chroococcidiopsis sp. CCNUC1]PSB42922.1 lipopolysaccharide biosynthesis protein [Cyanosarcina cf. burmensis CCALA 770]URD52774.1 polysaccharide biosynthesis tyrosine autokinase [Chroococcidiopsis sp. CCNUC1]
MESRVESREAVDINLQNLQLAIKRRWLAAAGVFGFVLGLSTIVTLLQAPLYQAEGKLLLKKPSETSSLNPEKYEPRLEPLSAESNPVSTESEIVSSIPLAQKTIAALTLKDEEGKPLKPTALISQLTLKNIPATDVLQVAYESKDPQEAAAVVNKLMSAYVDYNIQSNRAEASAAEDFIVKQLPQTESTVRAAEASLRRFKERHQIVSLEHEAISAVEVLKELQDQITLAEAALVQTQGRATKLQKEIALTSQDVVPINSLKESPGIQKTLAELQRVEGDLVVLQTRFEDTYPEVQKLQQKRNALKQLLEGRIGQMLGNSKQVSNRNLEAGELQQKLAEDLVRAEVERLSLSNRLKFLAQARTNYRQRATVLPQLEQQQRELERQVRAAQATYELMLKKLQELRVEQNRNIGNASIIETALVPETPLLGKRVMTLGLGGIAAILLAIATITLLELSDASIKTLREIKQLFGYTLIGSIPQLGKFIKLKPERQQDCPVPELAVRNSPRSLTAEAYRMLQANLRFLNLDRPLKAVVVTSSVPKEGKSTVCANLAVAIAQLGRRVLLIDADLRSPIQHHIWQQTNVEGLSHVLVGGTDFQAAVEQVMPNLHVLTAGVVPPNPMALIDSQRMAALVSSLSDRYDFVIIDAPPLVVAADALTLGKITDGILLVARLGVVDYTNAAAAREALKCSCQTVLGVVANSVPSENRPYSSFHSQSQDNLDTTVVSSR